MPYQPPCSGFFSPFPFPASRFDFLTFVCYTA